MKHQPQRDARLVSAGGPRPYRVPVVAAEDPPRAVLEPSVLGMPDRACQAVERWAARGFESIEVHGPVRAEVLSVVIDAVRDRGLAMTWRLGPPGGRSAATPGTPTERMSPGGEDLEAGEIEE